MAGPASATSRERGRQGLVTGEAVELEIPTASVGLRGLAYLVDLVVLVVAVIAVFWVGFALVSAVFAGDVGSADAAAWVVVTLAGALLIVVPAGVEWLSNGRSLGKVIAKLRVVTVEAGPTSWRHALVRATSITARSASKGSSRCIASRVISGSSPGSTVGSVIRLRPT